MSFQLEGSTVKIEMSLDDWEQMLVGLGIAGGLLHGQKARYGTRQFWRFMALVNRLNEGNLSFTPYEIPEEFRK